MFTRQSHLRDVGNTEVSAGEIKRMARLATTTADHTPIDIKIFWTSIPHHGGSPESTQVIFDRFDDELTEEMLFGHTQQGEGLVFMMKNDARPATVLTVANPPNAAGG